MYEGLREEGGCGRPLLLPSAPVHWETLNDLARSEACPSWREHAEYGAVRALVGVLGALPRRLARALGAGVGYAAYLFATRLRQVGKQNLALAFPDRSRRERDRILRTSFRNLGWQLAEFAQMSRYSGERSRRIVRYEGLEHYLAARDAAQGVLVLTGHLGAWELSSFFHSLMGYPMGVVIRRLDNRRVNAFVNSIRTLHGNRVLPKDEFARGLLKAMHAGETVGLLMDTNMTPPQGVFVPFFGKDACTASGLARVAARSGAAVLPGFLLWEGAEDRYVLHFGPPLQVVNTGETEADALSNTALFTRTLEDWIRRYPEQWLWVHRRWKTRPAGEASLYA